MRRLAIVGGVAFLATCSHPISPRPCTVDGDCLRDGVQGFCTPSRSSDSLWCAFADEDCASGRRYGIRAGDSLVDECVPAYTVTVEMPDAGAGTVTSTPAGLDCTASCQASFPIGTVLSATATAADTSVFMGWSNACSGTTTCVQSSAQPAGKYRTRVVALTGMTS